MRLFTRDGFITGQFMNVEQADSVCRAQLSKDRADHWMRRSFRIIHDETDDHGSIRSMLKPPPDGRGAGWRRVSEPRAVQAQGDAGNQGVRMQIFHLAIMPAKG